MAELGAIAEPIVTKLKQLAAELLQQITPFVELIGNGLVGALTGAEGAAQQFTDGLLGMVTFAIQKLTEMLPTFINFAFQMIANIATGNSASVADACSFVGSACSRYCASADRQYPVADRCRITACYRAGAGYHKRDPRSCSGASYADYKPY